MTGLCDPNGDDDPNDGDDPNGGGGDPNDGNLVGLFGGGVVCNGNNLGKLCLL